MDPLRWEAIRKTFEELVELDADARALRLKELRTSDAKIFAAVAAMLAADEGASQDLGQLEAVVATSVSSDRESATASSLRPDPFGLSGQTLSHFRILEPLGAGGMGFVYRAEDTRLRRLVALKFLLPQFSLESAARERFLHEARSAGSLDHPNLCTIYDVDESDGRLFLSMPLYPGETLKTRLAREGTLPVAEAVQIARQIAHGLVCAHAAGIVHRDLKPGNVMLLPDGTVKILDFGLAKARDVSMTEAGGRIGTVAYMAPEQLLDQPIDQRTDLWALGVVLYEMLTGTRPFDAQHEASVVRCILQEAPALPSALCPELPTELDEIVATLLAKDPGGRYATASGLLARIHLTELAVPASLPLRTGRRRWYSPEVPRRVNSRRGVALAAGVGVIVLAGALIHVARGILPYEDDGRLDRIAVLPLQVAGSGAGEELAAALQIEIITRLGNVSGLHVVNYESTRGYVGSTRLARDIGEELGVEVILGGTVQQSGNEVLVAVQLTDAGTNQTLWTAQYRNESPGALLSMQAEMAKDIVDALQVRLTAGERQRLSVMSTRSSEAAKLYTRGRQYEALGQGQLAGTFYERAIALDSGFALAHARNAIAQGQIYRFGGIGTARWSPAQAERVRMAAETAIRLDPSLPESRLAMGAYWYFIRSDYPRALAEMEVALEGLTNDATAHGMIAAVQRRQGLYDDAIAGLQRVTELDPLSAGQAVNLAWTYWGVRRYREAVGAYDRALEIAPDRYQDLLGRGWVFFQWQGSTDSLAAALRRIPPDWDDNTAATVATIRLGLLRRRPAEALAAIASMREGVLEARLASRNTDLIQYRAKAYEQLGDSARARADHELIRSILEQARRERPEDPHVHADLGIAYAALGMTQQARESAQRAMDILPLAEDKWAAWIYMDHAAETYTRLGEKDMALELLEQLLVIPNGLSVHELRAEFEWEPLRDDPRFQRLIDRVQPA